MFCVDLKAATGSASSSPIPFIHSHPVTDINIISVCHCCSLELPLTLLPFLLTTFEIYNIPVRFDIEAGTSWTVNPK